MGGTTRQTETDDESIINLIISISFSTPIYIIPRFRRAEGESRGKRGACMISRHANVRWHHEDEIVEPKSKLLHLHCIFIPRFRRAVIDVNLEAKGPRHD